MHQESNGLSTGLFGLDSILKGVLSGDNIVWQIDSIDDYQAFVTPFVEGARTTERKLVYFRFAQNHELLGVEENTETVRLHPENGFDHFISEIFAVIEKNGKGVYYVFDCLTDLSVDWYSDRMLGNFFMLTCPYLHKYDTVAYFSLLQNHHSSHATDGINATAQIILDVYRDKNKFYVHPQKVLKRYSPTMYMLHEWDKNLFKPINCSATISEILSGVPQPWLDFTIHRLGIWTRTFAEAEEICEDKAAGRTATSDAERYFQRILRMAVTRDPKHLELAQKFFDLADLLNIRKRMIGTGLISGKALGMLLARAILDKSGVLWRGRLEAHDSFFIGSDVFYTYLVQNGCWWDRHKLKDPELYIDRAEEAQERMLSGSFPEYIKKQFIEMLNYFGQSPIIVRSSSLLEDNFGNAFPGKYESVFCTNQGTPIERLESFIAAVRTIYASSMSREALHYRARHGLLEKEEQMALIVQRVSGTTYGSLFFPHLAGVAYSYNPYVWDKAIDPAAGVMRLVFGLGTRAVDHTYHDYTRIVALNEPFKRPESAEGIRKFSQHRVDVLDLRAGQLVSSNVDDIVKEVPEVPISIFSSYDESLPPEKARLAPVLTFDPLLTNTEFIQDMRLLIQTLRDALHYPFDIEFTANFLDDGSYRINLVQCRPFYVKELCKIPPPSVNIRKENIFLETLGPIIGRSINTSIDRLLYVAPSEYGQMKINDRYALARVIGQLIKKDNSDRNKIIMLVGPGRWGTTTPSLGVPVAFADINTVSVICEIESMNEYISPDLSLGTHFFNDLVESEIVYMGLFPGDNGTIFNEKVISALPNMAPDILHDTARWAHVLWYADGAHLPGNSEFYVHIDTLKQHGICFVDRKG